MRGGMDRYMWMCDRCREMNDERSSMCSQCKRSRTETDTAAPMFRPDRHRTPQSPVSTRPTIKPVSMISLYVLYGIVGIIEALPLILFGSTVNRLVYTAFSTVPMTLSVFNLWKQIDLAIRGEKSEGTVNFVELRQGSENRLGWSSKNYFTHVAYVVDGQQYEVRSEYGLPWQTHEVGQTMTVWYDRGSPEISVIGSRTQLLPIFWLAFAIAVEYFIYSSGFAARQHRY